MSDETKPAEAAPATPSTPVATPAPEEVKAEPAAAVPVAEPHAH